MKPNDAEMLAWEASGFCSKLGDIVSAGEFEDAITKGLFTEQRSNEDRHAYADLVLSGDARGQTTILLAPPLAGMAKVYLVWLLRNAEGPC